MMSRVISCLRLAAGESVESSTAAARAHAGGAKCGNESYAKDRF